MDTVVSIQSVYQVYIINFPTNLSTLGILQFINDVKSIVTNSSHD